MHHQSQNALQKIPYKVETRLQRVQAPQSEGTPTTNSTSSDTPVHLADKTASATKQDLAA